MRRAAFVAILALCACTGNGSAVMPSIPSLSSGDNVTLNPPNPTDAPAMSSSPSPSPSASADPLAGVF